MIRTAFGRWATLAATALAIAIVPVGASAQQRTSNAAPEVDHLLAGSFRVLDQIAQGAGLLDEPGTNERRIRQERDGARTRE